MGLARAVRYRVDQFVRALTARYALSEERVGRATAILTPEARALFAEQAPQDQRHAIEVYETLLARAHTNRDLLTAALLHDVGKVACQATPWKRGLLVLSDRFAPRVAAWFCRDGTRRCQDSSTTYRRHAEIGARCATEAGCSPLTVDLIRNHERAVDRVQTERDRLLAALQAADNVN